MFVMMPALLKLLLKAKNLHQVFSSKDKEMEFSIISSNNSITPILSALCILSSSFMCLAEAGESPVNHVVVNNIKCVVEPDQVIDVRSASPSVLEAVYTNRSEKVAKDSVLETMGLRLEERTTQLVKTRLQSILAIEENKKRRIRAMVDESAIPINDSVEFIDEQSVLSIARINPLHVNAVLPLRFLPNVGVGMTASVILGLLGEKIHKAKIIRVDRVADTANGTFGIQLRLNNHTHKIPLGVRCQLSLDTNAIARPAIATALTTGIEITSSNNINNNEPAKIMALAVRNADEFYNSTKLSININGNQSSLSPNEKEVLIPSSEPYYKSAENISPSNTDDEVPNISASRLVSQCIHLGPVSSLDEYQSLNDILGLQYGEKIHSSVIDYTGQTYLLMTPVLDKPEIVTESLQEYNINDYLLMSHGIYKGRISLGFFKHKSFASNKKMLLDSLDIKSEILPRNSMQHWLILRNTASSEQNINNSLKERIQLLGFPIQWLKKDC